MTSPPPRPSPPWAFAIAYALLALPLLYTAVFGGPYPPPADLVAGLHVCVALAVGAAVFIVRRRRRDLAGWAGLVVWGGAELAAVAWALTR